MKLVKVIGQSESALTPDSEPDILVRGCTVRGFYCDGVRYERVTDANGKVTWYKLEY